ncbi:hypothetical protein HG537_0C01480 [Torulaspora globosa]|uniref:E3 ubiquitin-protein ligase PEP5 n=1 Tax=Torulaspora globosa TaxID=48254 RepID=A0A7H9HQE5_9SACH|nr:hypothetical protein HG537_0C01480 [Torulaspora sp. CBS 2947]
MLSSWRQFQFYESVPLRDPLLGSDSPLYADPTVSAAAALGRSRLVVAVRSNVVRMVDLRNSRVEHEFQAFQDGYQINHLEIAAQGFLVAVAEQVGRPSLIRIYKLQGLPSDEKSYHAEVEVKNGNNTFPITVVSISRDLSCIAVGFANGRILLIRGDLPRDRGSRQRIIYEDPSREPLTSLCFNADATICFASTTARVLLFNTTGRNKGQPDLVLEPRKGVDLHCGVFNKFTNEYVCVLEDNLMFFGANGDRKSMAINVPAVHRVCPIDKDHILLVLQAEYSQSTVLEVEELSQSNANKVIIIDLRNKFIAFDMFISSMVVDVLLADCVYLLTSEVLLHQVTQRPLQEQLDIVIKKELFPFALELADQHNLDPLEIQNIHKEYGDWLYKKDLKSDAVDQYIQCLDVVETSEVISKFGIVENPDPRGLENLADFLWSLVKKDIANSDHITLLLIALIKMKSEDQLRFFIDHFTRSGKFSEEIITTDLDDEAFFYSDKTLFDLELVVSLLQESNYPSLAYQLVSRYARDPVLIVEVLLTSLNDPHSALKYIRSLSIDDTLRILVAYSKKLLEKLPNETNLLLIDVFTGKYKPVSYDMKADSEPDHDQQDENIVFYSYKTFLGYMNDKMNKKKVEDHKGVNRAPTYHPPKPSLVFIAFISKPFEFVVFLEACLESYQQYEGSREDKQMILTTLYDLYLSLAASDVAERQDDWKIRAERILKLSNELVTEDSASTSGKPIDNSLMMLIAHMNELDIYSVGNHVTTEKSSSGPDSAQKAGLVNTMRSLIFAGEAVKCLGFLETHAETEPYLYRVALTYFISSKHVLKEIGGEKVLKEKLLYKIVRKGLMTILDLLQLLASTNVVTYGVVQDILINHVQQEEDQIKRTRKLIDSYKAELDAKKEKLDSLSRLDEPSRIRLKNLKCCMCNTTLELPIVYFKCDHVYHKRCLNEIGTSDDGESLFRCPKCIVETETSEKLLQAQREASSKLDLLQMALNDDQNTKDRFKVVTEFIGRGGLDHTCVTLDT